MHIQQIRTLQPGQKIRVLVVDDSVVIRRLVCHALEEDRSIEVIGVASDGVLALKRIAQLLPDVITLDVEMPELDGIEVLRELRKQNSQTRVVMFSTMTERGASATLEALSLGADDYVTKASNAGSLNVSLASLRSELIPKIRQFFRHTAAQVATPPRSVPPPIARGRVDAVAIGISTGGPSALGAIVPQFPPEFGVPVFIVQHMPPLFTRLLAERLNTLTPLDVREATAGEPVRPGTIYLAPGDFHMRVQPSSHGLEIALNQDPPQNSCRPSVDVLFASLAEICGRATVAAVLTGMGQDGRAGAERLAAQGAHIIAQDEASSVVWGMPGAVVNAGVAREVLALDQIIPAIVERVASV
jgi:two-component system chemotaxis response regulator CheB